MRVMIGKKIVAMFLKKMKAMRRTRSNIGDSMIFHKFEEAGRYGMGVVGSRCKKCRCEGRIPVEAFAIR